MGRAGALGPYGGVSCSLPRWGALAPDTGGGPAPSCRSHSAPALRAAPHHGLSPPHRATPSQLWGRGAQHLQAPRPRLERHGGRPKGGLPADPTPVPRVCGPGLPTRRPPTGFRKRLLAESTSRTEILFSTVPAAPPAPPGAPGRNPPGGRDEEPRGRGTGEQNPRQRVLPALPGAAGRPGALVTAGPSPQLPAPGSAPPCPRRCSGGGAGGRAIAGALRGSSGLAPAPLQGVGGRPQAQDLPAAQARAPSVEHSELWRKGRVMGGGCPGYPPGPQSSG